MSALASRSFVVRPQSRTEIQMPIGARRDQAARETDSARQTRPGLGAAESRGSRAFSAIMQNRTGRRGRKWLVDEIVSV